jgi:hypothetical protein
MKNRALLTAAFLTTTPLLAQELVRVPVPPKSESKPSATRVPDEKARPANPLETVTNGRWIEPQGDKPDFAPTVREDITKDDVNRIAVPLGNPYVLSFTGGDYTPEPGFDAKLLRKIATGDRTYGFIMIKGRMSRAKMATLAKLGVVHLGRHTWQSIKAVIPEGAVHGLRTLPFVHWVGEQLPEQKISASLAKVIAIGGEGQEFDIVVNFFESDMGEAAKVVITGTNKRIDKLAVVAPLSMTIPNGPSQKALEGLGFEFEYYDDRIFAMRGRATRAEILEIRKLNRVYYIELHESDSHFHDQTMAMVSQDRIRGTWDGTDVPVGIIDTGLDNSPWHNDLTGKAYVGWDTTGIGAFADGRGHGTHVAGTVFGRGIADKRYMGACPDIGSGLNGDRIFIGRYLDDSGTSVGSVSTLYDALKVDYTNTNVVNPRPTLINCSWGSKSTTGYYGTESKSRTIDDIVHQYNQCYVFSSGNIGSTAGTWGAQPGVAKNVLTVASIKDKFNWTDGPGEPSTFNRYGSIDGRRKPEVAAPGEVLTSCDIDTSTGYTNKSGTSMAAPMTVGCLASVVDRDSNFLYQPASLKALAVGAARAGTSIGFDTVQGFGLINSYKMNYGNSRSSWSMKKGSFTYPTVNASEFFVTIPSNAVASKIVLTWLEPSASGGALKARVNSLRLWMDVPPYSAGASGDVSLVSSVNTVVFGTGLTNTLKGQSCRFTVHADSLAVGHRVNWAVCVFWYLKSPTTSNPTISISADDLIVQSGETVTLTSTITAGTNDDEFSSAQMYVDLNTGTTNTQIERTTIDSILQSYIGTSFPSNPFPVLGMGKTKGMTVGQGTSRTAKFDILIPVGNQNRIYTVSARHHQTSTPITSSGVTICVDDLAPNAITDLSASKSISTWYNNAPITFTWTPPTDTGCAGMDVQRYELSSSGLQYPTTLSPSLGSGIGSVATNLTSGTSHYFAIRGYDKAANYPSAATIGPFWIDLTLPVIGIVSASKLVVTVPNADLRVIAIDTYSGLDSMQYSMDGATWSPKVAYTPNFANYDLTLYGGNSNIGIKRVHFRVFDKAGNQSATSTIDIRYVIPPVIITTKTPSLPAVNYASFQFGGTGFKNVTRVQFGTKLVTTKFTSQHHDWYGAGAFRVISDTELRIYAPQGLPPGPTTVRVFNPAQSNAFTIQLTPNLKPIVRTNYLLRAGSPQQFFVTKGNLNATVSQQIIMASVFKTPSVLGNIFNFGIGANFTQLVSFPALGFDPNDVSRVQIPTSPAWVGITAYFQSAYLDFVNPVWPMPASDIWQTTYK